MPRATRSGSSMKREMSLSREIYLYVAHPAYFVTNIKLFHIDMAKESGQARVPFAGMADVVDVWAQDRKTRHCGFECMPCR